MFSNFLGVDQSVTITACLKFSATMQKLVDIYAQYATKVNMHYNNTFIYNSRRKNRYMSKTIRLHKESMSL